MQCYALLDRVAIFVSASHAPCLAATYAPTRFPDPSSQVAQREKEVERRAKAAEEQLAKAEKMMQDCKAGNGNKTTIPSVPMFDGAKDRKAPTPVVPMFDKENMNGKPSKDDAPDTQNKPLQPLHNIYDRREKLLARLLNHRMGTAE